MIASFIVLLATAEAVVAHAGRDEITSAQLKERIALARAAGGDARPELLVEDLINEALMAQEGDRKSVV